MTDPDLVFELDPQNLQRVESWLGQLCPDTRLNKDSDGSRLTWTLDTPRGTMARVVATESFLTLPRDEVDRLLGDARRICDEQNPAAPWYLLLAVDGVRAEQVPTV